MVNVSSGQKRPGAPLASPMQKMKTTVHYRKVLPVTPADVKFPVVTHKEIQVEIVPSEDARINNNIDKYEIEFKGRKTPNKYSVKPNIKIVKLIGLQSDTEYLIKVYAIRNKSKFWLDKLKYQIGQKVFAYNFRTVLDFCKWELEIYYKDIQK